MAGDDVRPETFDLPPLREIERDGAEAARRQARSILAETLANNGSVNLARLNRAGPEVRTIYLELLAQHAKPPTPSMGVGAPASAGVGGTARAGQADRRPPRRAAPKTSATPRTTTDWKDLRRRARPFWVEAIAQGLFASTTVGVTGFIVVLIFQL